MRLHFAHLENNPKMAIVTQIELRQSNRKVRKGIAETLKKYMDVIDDIIRSGIEQGIFRAGCRCTGCPPDDFRHLG